MRGSVSQLFCCLPGSAKTGVLGCLAAHLSLDQSVLHNLRLIEANYSYSRKDHFYKWFTSEKYFRHSAYPSKIKLASPVLSRPVVLGGLAVTRYFCLYQSLLLPVLVHPDFWYHLCCKDCHQLWKCQQCWLFICWSNLSLSARWGYCHVSMRQNVRW